MATARKASAQQSWSRRIESDSLRSRDAVPKDAARYFDRQLSAAQQMQLVGEIVATRAAELTLAYKNVVMVTAGHKKRTDKHGREQLLRQPCVVLVVRDKWSPSRDAKAGAQLIPKRLLACTTVAGQRMLCAVPTDVQHEKGFYGAAPQSQRAIYPQDPKIRDEFGTLTCAVRVANLRMVLSCRHVLSPKPEIGSGAVTAGVVFAQLLNPQNPPGGPGIGSSAAIAGPLRDRADPSHDAQLGLVADAAWPLLRSLFSEMPLSAQEPFVGSRERFDELLAARGFEILVPDNNPLAGMKPRPTYLARFDAYLPSQFHFDYPVRVNGQPRICRVSHWELLKFRLAANRSPLPGDSGSPVVTWNSDGSCTLVGMHIAGVAGEPFSYAIPSWQLFAGSNYLGLPAGAVIAPFNP